jgi:hypothetical protein
MRLSKSTYLFVSLVTVAASLLVPFGNTQTVHAITGSSWQAGRIIEDSIFTNADNMSVGDIQAFLNAQVPNCDTWGTGIAREFNSSLTRSNYAASQGWSAPPYVCLKDYTEVPKTGPGAIVPDNSFNHFDLNTKKLLPVPNGLSAAQLIYDAAQKYKINPRVLLVKLATESSGPLTSDTWPLYSQYKYAMGAHCPDSGPGGSANCDANYAGFSLQVSEAAALLRWYLDSMTQSWWSYKKPFQTNYVLWNVEPSGCGGNNVFINTKATAALYTYTPYQPNGAALNNMYGKGDGCSAYGNRNFWRVYYDWFGSPTFGFTKSSAESNYAKSPCTIPTFLPQLVGRLYQPDSRDYLYTMSQAEACAAIKVGYIWDGMVFKDASGLASAVPVYRLSGIDRHIFTATTTVRDDYVNSRGYKDEGIAFYAQSAQDANNLPVMSLQKDFTTLLTSAGKEAELYQQDGFNNGGTVFYTPALATGQTPVYRLSRLNSRLYTTNGTEKTSALQSFGFTDEGTITMNDLAPNQANAPLYRLRSPSGDYFYTNSRYERDAAVVLYGYFSEGIGFYTLLYSNAPAYRAVDPTTARRIFTNSMLEYDLAQSRYHYLGEAVGWYGYGN